MTDPRALLSEIGRLNAERAEMLADYENCCASVGVASIMEMLDLINRLKAELAAAEEATRKALEAIPTAMDAAVAKEREACAKIAEELDTSCGQYNNWALADLFVAEVSAAIRARTTEAGQ